MGSSLMYMTRDFAREGEKRLAVYPPPQDRLV